MYHRVAETVPAVAPPTMNVTPRRLRQQLSGLFARLCMLAFGGTRWRGQCAFAKRFLQCVRSYVRDGDNNHVHAWPVLCELNVPATIFLATKYLDSDLPFPFDDWSAVGSHCVPSSAWRPLSTTQCREMLADGLIELGAHTHGHDRFLGRCDDFKRDMQLCLNLLRDRFGIDRPPFAFPFGHKDSEMVDVCRQLNVSCSLSTHPGRVKPGDDEYEWGRFWVAANDSPAVLAAKLSGWYATVSAAGKSLADLWPRFSRPQDIWLATA